MLHIACYLGGVSRHVRVSPHTARWLPIRLHRKSAEERDSKPKVRKANLKSNSWTMHIKSEFVVTIWSPLSKFRLRPTLIPHFKTTIKISSASHPRSHFHPRNASYLLSPSSHSHDYNPEIKNKSCKQSTTSKDQLPFHPNPSTPPIFPNHKTKANLLSNPVAQRSSRTNTIPARNMRWDNEAVFPPNLLGINSSASSPIKPHHDSPAAHS